MQITVDPEKRSAVLANPGLFAAGEAVAVAIAGLVSPVTASLRLGLYSDTGTLLALCSGFAQAGATWTGTLDTRTTPVDVLFADKKADVSLKAFLVLVDDNRLWFAQRVEIINNALRGSPLPPDPQKVYITADLFSAVEALGAEATGDDMAAKLNTVLAILKGET